ncbi:MAG: type IV toxin-antitoxin system AbiEi family antitoxin domain-containing protein [Prevotellaceae bacterium]|jgi:predicted transcriptional regulator of viral defense system|nr:type IV toxin-antitoxin system AbiEi family antitoxin domain-containing protein [Prevotellaceae bacterium]
MGNCFFADDFAALGTADAIRLALGKLQKSGVLMRVAHGIYYYPKKDAKYGLLSVLGYKIS